MDNQRVINKIDDLILCVNVTPNEVFIPEWDVLAEIKHTLAIMHAKISIIHVKAHQDKIF